jgi:ABC-type transport system substrate-binding protein
MLVNQRAETDAAKRRELIREAVRYINTEAYWAVALYYDVSTEFWHPSLKGYAPSFGNQTGGGDPPSWDVSDWLDR